METTEPDIMIETFSSFIKQTSEESDRGSVLVAVSIIDDILAQLLKVKLVPTLERNDELFDGAYAPFSSFSARIDLAYRVALIGTNTRRSCHILRKIRNDFAHATEVKGFTHSATQDRIRELFKLNSNMVELLEKVIIEGTKGHEIEIREFNDLIKKFGWRFVFQLLFASLASSLAVAIDEIQGIKPLSLPPL